LPPTKKLKKKGKFLGGAAWLLRSDGSAFLPLKPLLPSRPTLEKIDEAFVKNEQFD